MWINHVIGVGGGGGDTEILAKTRKYVDKLCH
jgi:hypothetical protein